MTQRWQSAPPHGALGGRPLCTAESGHVYVKAAPATPCPALPAPGSALEARQARPHRPASGRHHGQYVSSGTRRVASRSGRLPWSSSRCPYPRRIWRCCAVRLARVWTRAACSARRCHGIKRNRALIGYQYCGGRLLLRQAALGLPGKRLGQRTGAAFSCRC